jgi:hypothetical protein
MELNLLAAPNETILTELLGWGEVPFDWVSDRAKEFDEAVERETKGYDPVWITSQLPRPNSCEWKHIFMMPIIPSTEKHVDLVDCMLSKIAKIDSKLFRIDCVHDGVKCVAFM